PEGRFDGGRGFGFAMAGDFGEDGQTLGRPVTFANRRSSDRWLRDLFPDLPASPAAIPAASTWPAEARDLARSLLRADALAKLNGGLLITRQTDSFDVRWGDLADR